MKKIIFILIAAIGLTVTSCKKLEEYNIDPKNASTAPAATLFANGLRNLVDQEMTTSVNENVFRAFAQYWTETTYTDESNYDITTRQIPDYEFRIMYRDVLANLAEAEKIIASESSVESTVEEKANKTAVCEMLMIFSYAREIDIFGAAPYSESLDIENISPVYEDGAAVYAKLFDRLDAAIASIDVNSGGFETGDLVYYGDMAKWKAFGNSLKLKMAITVADVSSLNPGAKAASAVTGGVFASSGDDAHFTYLTESPNVNPIWIDLISTGRHDWVAANTLVDTMNALSDPRRPAYFEQNLDPPGTYIGGTYGDNNPYKSYTHITMSIQAPDYPGVLMTYTEVLFYLTEASARGWAVGGAPDIWYNAAVTNSIMADWGGSSTDAADYLTVAPFPTAGTEDEQWDAIALQSWIASYDRGLIGWTTYRRLDAPSLVPPAISGEPVPKRYTFPATEQTLNGANYTAAAAAMGGDVQQSRIFWDIH